MKQNDDREQAVPDLCRWLARCRYLMVPMAMLVWLAGISFGMFALLRYAHDPGTLDSSPMTWPAASRIPRPDDRPVLLLFAHPRCPCTRASLRELERLATRYDQVFEPCIVFTDVHEGGEHWIQTDLRGQARAIRAARVWCDQEAVESQLFRAHTSGLALLYSCRGVLLFEGGITASRGHEGSNVGITALEAIFRKEKPSISQTIVFGCPLQTPMLATSQGAVR